MTKVEYFEKLKSYVTDDQELVDFLDKEIALTNKRNSKKSKASKTTVENNGYRDMIVKLLNDRGEALTIAEMRDSIEEFTAFSSQKITGLLNPLVHDGTVTKLKIGKVTKFTTAATEAEDEE